MKLKNRLNQISRLLTKEEKISGFKLLLCIILMGVLDVLGVASILPFMSLASDPNFLESNELLLDVYKRQNLSVPIKASDFFTKRYKNEYTKPKAINAENALTGSTITNKLTISNAENPLEITLIVVRIDLPTTSLTSASTDLDKSALC